MTSAFLEHVNVTVSDPDATANRLVNWFGWRIRWKGPAKNGGTTVHVGNDTSYLAVYSAGAPEDQKADSGSFKGGLNHIAIVVDDLDAVEKRILAGGYKTINHADYEPGRRFYFYDDDAIEFEIVSYAKQGVSV
ncbi:VOC family protein [Pseudovibrio sp. Tun.PSC04-5.I4]|uniref:VOC family protein n=1 Tax=Pseudovibrio sp. Tun.PSC04-5.I4 TaxID=1798213 RepID=UPI00088CAD8B|nr:VOC family protein [Pseudovibrio sp. Tun.PSC04-5.I4]SDQ24601.1 Catechol 2,3-dioxygenase [Pseudovibrio sp. Tun.PSC04-5.I4]